MKSIVTAMTAAAAFMLTACGQEKAPAPAPVEKATPAPDLSFLDQKCDAATLVVNSFTNAIDYAQTDGKLKVRVYRAGRMEHTPELDTAGTKPQYSGPAYDAWLERRNADQAILRGGYNAQAEYALGLFAKKCPDNDLSRVREHLKLAPKG